MMTIDGETKLRQWTDNSGKDSRDPIWSRFSRFYRKLYVIETTAFCFEELSLSLHNE